VREARAPQRERLEAFVEMSLCSSGLLRVTASPPVCAEKELRVRAEQAARGEPRPGGDGPRRPALGAMLKTQGVLGGPAANARERGARPPLHLEVKASSEVRQAQN
jgi:hypothetical protein